MSDPKEDRTKTQRTEIAGRLRMAREAAGLSQGQAAKKLGLHRPTVSEIEAGRRRVGAEELGGFADLYRVDANWIVGGAGDASADRVMLAARKLEGMTGEDLDRLMGLLEMLRGGEDRGGPEAAAGKEPGGDNVD